MPAPDRTLFRLAAGPAAGGWLLLSGLLAAGSLLALAIPAVVLDWQPEMAGREPWRAWSAAWVHWSALHLGANLLGLALVATLGAVGRVGTRWAVAWALAWPLTHAALWVRPDLLHYGGMSGVLHAGVAVAAVSLWVDANSSTPGAPADRRQRTVAAAIALGLTIKIVSEAPWGPTLRHGADWDIAVAPLAHATGAAAGTLCAVLAAALQLTRRRQPMGEGRGESPPT